MLCRSVCLAHFARSPLAIMLEAPPAVGTDFSWQQAPAADVSASDTSARSGTSTGAPSMTLTYCPPAHTSWATFGYTSTAVHTYATTTLYTTLTRTLTHSAPAATVSVTTTAVASESSPVLPSTSSFRSISPPLPSDTRAPSRPHRRRPYGVAHIALSHSGQRHRRTQGSAALDGLPSLPSWNEQHQQTWTEHSLVPTLATSAVVSQPSCYVTVVPVSAGNSLSSNAASSSAAPGSPIPLSTSSPTPIASTGVPGLYTRTRLSYATVSEMDYYTVTRTFTSWDHAPSSATNAANRTASAGSASSLLPDGTLAQGRQSSLMASNEVGKIIGGVVGGVGGSLVLLLLLLCLVYPARRRRIRPSSKNGVLAEKGPSFLAQRPSQPPSATVAAAGDASNPLSANARVEPSATDPTPLSPSGNGRLVRIAGFLGFTPPRQERLDRLFNPSQVLRHGTSGASSTRMTEVWQNTSDVRTPDFFDHSPVDGAMQMTLSTSLGTMDSPEPYGAGAPGTPRAWVAPFGRGAAQASPEYTSMQGQSPTAATSTEMRHSPTVAAGSMPPSLGTSGNLAAAQGQSPSPDTTPSPQTPVNPIAAPLVGPGQWLSGKHVDPGTPEEALASEGPAPMVQSEDGNDSVDAARTTESVSLRQEEAYGSSDELEGEPSMASALSFLHAPPMDYTMEGDLSNRSPTGPGVPTTASGIPFSSSFAFPATSSIGSADAHHVRPARPSSPLLGEGAMERMDTVQPSVDQPASLHGASVLHMPVPVRPVVLPREALPSSTEYQASGPVGPNTSEPETMSESDPTDFQTALSVSVPQLDQTPLEAASRGDTTHVHTEQSATSSPPVDPTTWADTPVAFPVPTQETIAIPTTPVSATFPPSRYSQTLGKLESEEEDQMATVAAQGSPSSRFPDQSGDPTPRRPRRPLKEAVKTVGSEVGARSSVYSPRPPDWPVPTPDEGASYGPHDGKPVEGLASSEASENSAAAHGGLPAQGASWMYEPQSRGEGLPPMHPVPSSAGEPQPYFPQVVPHGVSAPAARAVVAEGDQLSVTRTTGAGPMGATSTGEPSSFSASSAQQETLSAETLPVAASQSASPVGFLPVPVIIDPNFSSESSAQRMSGESFEQPAAPEGASDGFFGRPRSGPLLVVNTDPQAPQSSSSTLPPRSD